MDKRHLIAKRAARYFQSGDVVNLGIGIPSLCGNYAEPGVLFQAENGFIGVPFIPVPGSSGFDVAMAFGVIRSGRLAATVLGALQVSERGDLANWSTPGRSFGMGGAMDLVNGARKVIVAMEHCTREGAPKIVKECTLPYTGRGCVDHIVTELCVIDVTKEGLLLRELAPGHTLEEVRAKTEAELSLAEDLREMVI